MTINFNNQLKITEFVYAHTMSFNDNGELWGTKNMCFATVDGSGKEIAWENIQKYCRIL